MSAAGATASATRSSTLWALVELTKPRIIQLLLITTIPAMIIAQDGWPDTWLVVTTLVGGTLSAAGANAINHYLDRDIDVLMQRTARRPLPTRRVQPSSALAFGLGLGLGGFIVLWAFVNVTAAVIATGALAFYVIVYSLWLKRTTAQNVVIGGAAGAAPVLVGWAAVTGTVELPALILFGIVFYWTPPHFWALALRFRGDYEKAGVPMLPVVAGVEATVRQIVLYGMLLFGLTLLLYPAVPMGWIYLTASVGLGLWFVVGSLRLRRDPARAMDFFHVSITYLALLFASMAIDRLVA